MVRFILASAGHVRLLTAWCHKEEGAAITESALIYLLADILHLQFFTGISSELNSQIISSTTQNLALDTPPLWWQDNRAQVSIVCYS